MTKIEKIDTVGTLDIYRLKLAQGWKVIYMEGGRLSSMENISDPGFAWSLADAVVAPATPVAAPVVAPTAPATPTPVPVVAPVPTPVAPTPVAPVTPVAPTAIPSGAAVIFDQGYQNTWTDFSFGVVNGGGSTQPVINGIKSLQVNLGAWGALNLYHPNLDQAAMGTLSFYLTLDSTVPNVYVGGGGQAYFKLPVVPTKGVRTKIDLKISDFVTGLFTNISIQPDAACVLTVDTMYYTTQVAPVVIAPVVAAPTTPVPLAPAATSRWVSGYYVGYEQSLYPPEAIDFTDMTHLVMGRIVPVSNGTLSTTFDYDAVQGPLLAKKVATLAHAAGKKAILMVGGSGTQAQFAGASSDTYRATFVANLIKTMTDYGYDGLDLDWEPISKTDEPTFAKLVKDIRRAAPTAIITVPVDWSSASPMFKDLAPYLDQINIMSYGMADGDGAGWSGWTLWHSSALDGEGATNPSSIQKIVDAYLAAGVPANKLGVGVGAYGSGWAGPTTVGQSTVGAKVIAGDGELSFTNITTKYLTAATASRDTVAAKVPYISAPAGLGTKKLTFISYEDEQSVLDKAAWCRAKGLGGAIIWTIGQQYNAAATVKNPILAAMKKGFLD